MAKRLSVLSRRAERVEKSGKRTRVKKIDFCDIPELSDRMLKSMRRVGRPPLGAEPRRLIAIRVDPQVLLLLQEEAEIQGIGYQTLINRILAEHAKKAV